MDFKEFVNSSQNKLLGYFLLASASGNTDPLPTPYPPAELSDEALEELRSLLNECMPIESMITDLWDWDIHFEQELGDDWYFDAVFGCGSALERCRATLVEFFVEECKEYGIDYNQLPDDPAFTELVQERAALFIEQWRKNVIAMCAETTAWDRSMFPAGTASDGQRRGRDGEGQVRGDHDAGGRQREGC